MEYACELWDGCTQQEADNLEHVQLEAGRLVTGLPVFASREAIYFETGWQLLVDRRKSRKLNMFYSLHNGTAPDYLCDVMPPLVGQVSNYDLRNSNNYVVPGYRLDITRKSFSPSTTIEWNSLPPDILTSKT
ncbi:uncharacterized protein LOC134726421 [Mytilus trossulus]|uniref:uncharacterized protein LOC134726421 n=1 Tax=Mytilus trossulus TaxID=6551 RepID=UPI003004F460